MRKRLRHRSLGRREHEGVRLGPAPRNAAARHAARKLPPITPEPDWAKIATAARSKVELLEARVRALERASPSKTRYYDSDESSEEEEFFYTRTPYTTKKLPPLDTLPARSLSAALRRGRPLRRDDYERRSLWRTSAAEAVLSP